MVSLSTSLLMILLSHAVRVLSLAAVCSKGMYLELV